MRVRTSKSGRWSYVLAFIAGAALGLPLATRPSVIGPICNTYTQGDEYSIHLMSATRNGASVAPPAGFDGTIDNAAARDAALVNATLYLDDGTGTAGPVLRSLRRTP